MKYKQIIYGFIGGITVFCLMAGTASALTISDLQGAGTPRVGALISTSDHTIYFVTANGLLGFPDIETFNSWGYNSSNIVPANSAESALPHAGIVPKKNPGCPDPLSQLTVNCQPSASMGNSANSSQSTGQPTNHAPVSVTSPGNTSITITATPGSWDGSTWAYTIEWSRKKSAQGSLKVYSSAKSTDIILGIATAGQNGSAAVTLNPSTSYRVKFFTQPSFGGTLLVSKTFTTQTAPSPYSQSIGLSSESSSVSKASGIQGSASRGFLQYGIQQVFTDNIQALGTKVVGGPIPITPATGSTCSNAQLTRLQESYFPTDQRWATPNFGCAHSNQKFIDQMYYKSSITGKCYFADMYATVEMPNCQTNTPIIHTNSDGTLSKSDLPNHSDLTFDWSAAGATCTHVDSVGVITDFICGSSPEGGLPPLPGQYCLYNPTAATCQTPSTYTYGNGATSSTIPGTDAQGWANRGFLQYGMQPVFTDNIQALGTKTVGGPIPHPAAAGSCTAAAKARLEESYFPTDQRWATADFGCTHSNQKFIDQLYYKSSVTGKCYFADMYATVEMANCQPNTPTLHTNSDGTLSTSDLPNHSDLTFDWSAAGATCTHVDSVGVITDFICGSSPEGGLPPLPGQYCLYNPTAATCQAPSTKTTTSSSSISTEPSQTYTPQQGVGNPSLGGNSLGGKACILDSDCIDGNPLTPDKCYGSNRSYGIQGACGY